MLEFTWAELKCDLQKCDFRICALILIPMLQARTTKVTCQCGFQLGPLSSLPGCPEFGTVLQSGTETLEWKPEDSGLYSWVQTFAAWAYG